MRKILITDQITDVIDIIMTTIKFIIFLIIKTYKMKNIKKVFVFSFPIDE
jgi:hypothetical protein